MGCDVGQARELGKKADLGVFVDVVPAPTREAHSFHTFELLPDQVVLVVETEWYVVICIIDPVEEVVSQPCTEGDCNRMAECESSYRCGEVINCQYTVLSWDVVDKFE